MASRLGIGCPLALTAILSTMLPGCVGLESFRLDPNAPPTGKACQIVATWNKEVTFAPDAANGGTPSPGITGRLYLFGPQIDYPIVGDGCLMVELYGAEAPAAAGTKTDSKVPYRLLEQWKIDRDTLTRLARKDTIGWGYTLFLPWGTYKPETTQVRLKVSYHAGAGLPLYTESGPLTLVRPKGM